MKKLEGNRKFQRSKAEPDLLFEAAYEHAGVQTCKTCSIDQHQDREPRDEEVMTHYGTIASGNQVIRDATVRDRRSAVLRDGSCRPDEQLPVPGSARGTVHGLVMRMDV